MRRTFLLVLAFSLGFAALTALPAGEQRIAAAATGVAAISAPPMGWNSWNKFACDIDENLIRQTADAMVTNGLDQLGYEYVNLDDCWMASTRDAQGRLQAHPTRFPNGIKALADYVHAKGLKLGIYSSAGTMTCMGLPASLDRETIDAQTFAAWGIDLLKYDNCHNQGRPAFQRYKAMGDALKATGRQIVYSVCNWGHEEPWLFGANVGASMWRTTGDITDDWASVLSLLDQQVGLEPFARKGFYNDPDMLEVGNGGMTTTEYTAHMSLWALLSAPLLLGNDLRSMSAETLAIVKNADVIAVNQDWGGSQGRRLRRTGTQEVWAKPMSDGSVAVVLFNRGTAAATITASAAEAGIGGWSSYAVKDLWTKATSTTSGALSATVPAHGVAMFRVTPTGSTAAAPAAGTHEVSNLTWLHGENGFGPAERNRSNGEQPAGDGRTLTIGGATFATGIGAHADSAVHVHLGRACSVFSAKVGIDDEVGDRGGVRFQAYGDGQLLGYTGVITGAQGSTAFSVAVGGYRTLELRVTDGRNTPDYDHADWAEARLTCGSAPGTGTAVSDRTFSSSTNGWGPVERDQSNGELAAGDGVVPNVAGVHYVRALGVHANSAITVPLGGSCERFTAAVGVDAETVGRGAVAFTVQADGATLASTPTLLPSQAAVIDVDVSGRQNLQLNVGTAGDDLFDHADWGDARLVC